MDQEDELGKALRGTGGEFGVQLPQHEAGCTQPIPTTTVPDCPGPNLSLTRDLLTQVVQNPDLEFLRDHSPHLPTFVSERVMHDLTGGLTDTQESIKGALRCASQQGVSSLREEANRLLAPDVRSGGKHDTTPVSQIVSFSAPRLGGNSTLTSMTLMGNEWQVFDFGDTLPATTDDPINEHYGKAQTDKNKCLLLHLAAAVLGASNAANYCGDYSDLKPRDIHALGAQFRWEQHQQAMACSSELCPPTNNDPLIVAELRSHVRDVLTINHDRDHRTLLCFPVSCLEWANVCIVRVSQSCRFSVHLINSSTKSKIWAYLVSYQEHMRATSPPNAGDAEALRSSPKTVTSPSGWESLLSFHSPSVSIDSRNLSRCPRCQSPNVRLPLGVEGTLVGRAMITTGRKLRNFNVLKPRTRSAALEHSAASLASWDYEHSTPPLGQSPTLPNGASEKLDQLFLTIPPEDTVFSYPLWGKIACETDDYVASTGDVSIASHAHTCGWRKRRNPTTLTPNGLSVFEGIVAPDLYQHALNISSHGVLPCGDRPPERFQQSAYANINDNPEATAAELWEDLVKGRLMIFTDRSEPFAGDLMGSKLAYVLQKDATNPDVVKVRYISDPRNEVNDRLENDRRPQCIIPRHQNVARRAMYWKRRYPAIPILISKRDFKGSFKLIPVSVRGLAYMGCRFAKYVAMYLAIFSDGVYPRRTGG